MQEEIRFATFNAFNLAPAGARLYEGLAPCTQEQYEAKIAWTAHQIDALDADVIGFQEIFSQQSLSEVLSRTERYRDAFHVGFDPDPRLEKLTPSVALVSRLPLAEEAFAQPLFPAGVTLPDGHRDAGRFARPVLQVALTVAPGLVVDVVVVHLKSQRPDYRVGDTFDDPHSYALGCLRSLMRRGTEAVALRVMLSDLRRETGRPSVVLGDFNDTVDAVTTSIVMGVGAKPQERFYDANEIRMRIHGSRNLGFSTVHDGRYSTIDHVLVSPEFNPALPGAIGEVVDVAYLNDHLTLGMEGASDHGQVVARVRLFDRRQAG
ncbi:endonuclease/exonuclease/phosphatase family protein [Pseudoduganella sp. GCM10020061]|uniref:endonuclease/exonuclease/phosphatase family protein n=1 Tax=Pseudoduganella sp. GCM10020061 TaxID=3317345 RepID=UPI00362C520F